MNLTEKFLRLVDLWRLLKMAKMYLKLILAGRITFSEVPANYQDEVKNLISQKALSGNLTAVKIWKELTSNV